MIELKNVSFSYQGQDHGDLHDVSLNIKDGECVLLCGRSGCGKTTITRLINGLIPYFYPGELTGDVLADGEAISEHPMYQIAAKVGSVFQNPRTQFFNVDTDSEIAFGIENEARPPTELTQRVEQTVQELHIEKLREHLRLIKAQGKTSVIAEHRLYYLMDIADRIVYLEQGRISGIYTPAEFQKLTGQQRKAMGLRAVKLEDERPDAPMCAIPPPVLELHNVSLHHQKRMILEHINLTAAPGEVIAVVGHNGAGKTTFSRALCGLHKHCEGDFLWNGIPLNHKKRLKRSYMVMQDVNYELFAESVEAECSFGIKNPDRQLIEQTMKRLGLYPFKDRHPNTLSGGQKQRVAVAVSMVGNRDLLVFDEPTSGLDYDSMTQVAGLIRELSKMGKLIFIVTHDYEFVCRTCSRVLHFDEGEMPDDLAMETSNLPRIRELFAIST